MLRGFAALRWSAQTLAACVAAYVAVGCGSGLWTSSTTTGNFGPRPIQVVQAMKSVGAGLNSITTTPLPVAPAVGNLLVVLAWGYEDLGSSFTGVNDNAGHIYNPVQSHGISGNFVFLHVWYTVVSNAVPNLAHTVTMGVVSDKISVSVVEVAGLKNPITVDVVSTGVQNSAVLSAGVIPTTFTAGARGIAVTVMGLLDAQTAISPPTGFSVIAEDLGASATGQTAFVTYSGSVSFSPNWSWTGMNTSFAAIVAAFREN